jgi:hypothetical protein
MATEEDVRAIALSLPGTTEGQWYQTPGYKVAEALLTSNPEAFFTTPHYDGYPAVLVNLEKVDHDELRELITESWLIKAPAKLRRQFEAQ